MRDGDYLEWQISYYTENKAESSVVPSATLLKDRKEVYGCEFIWLLAESLRIQIMSKQRLDEILEIASAMPSGGFAEEETIIQKEDLDSGELSKHGFRRFALQVPVHLKSMETFAVEIKIAPRQRAVGNQAMVFVHLPLSCCHPLDGLPPFVDRTAKKKERAEYRINAENIEILSDIATAFLLASAKHRDDMRKLLEQIR